MKYIIRISDLNLGLARNNNRLNAMSIYANFNKLRKSSHKTPCRNCQSTEENRIKIGIIFSLTEGMRSHKKLSLEIFTFSNISSLGKLKHTNRMVL